MSTPAAPPYPVSFTVVVHEVKTAAAEEPPLALLAGPGACQVLTYREGRVLVDCERRHGTSRQIGRQLAPQLLAEGHRVICSETVCNPDCDFVLYVDAQHAAPSTHRGGRDVRSATA